MIRDKRGERLAETRRPNGAVRRRSRSAGCLRFDTDGRLGRRQGGLGAEDLARQGRLQLLPRLGRRRSRRLSPSGPRAVAPRHGTHTRPNPETIQCGRPGTSMPHFDRFAYTDKRCYGMTAADLGDQMPDRSQVTLQRDEIDALADYVAQRSRAWARLPNSNAMLLRPRDGDLRHLRSQEPMSAIRSRRPVAG